MEKDTDYRVFQVSGNKAEIKAEEKNETACIKNLKILSKDIRGAIESLLKPFEARNFAVTFVILIITFVTNVAGAYRLQSNYPMERQLAVYLFINASFAFLFWIVILAVVSKEELAGTKRLHYTITVLKLFSFAWFLYGVYLLSKYRTMLTECPMYVNGWEPHFLRLAIAIFVMDGLLGLLFIIYGCYFVCNKYCQN